MPGEFNVSCPNCQSLYTVPVEFAGQEADCTSCRTRFQIPEPPSVQFSVSCPNCATSYMVPPEMGGQMAECASCGSIFKVPFLNQDETPQEASESSVAQEQSTATKAFRGQAPTDDYNPEITQTTKLSRSSIGMIPKAKDSFHFGPPQGAGVPPPPSGSAPPRPPSPSAHPPPSEDGSTTKSGNKKITFQKKPSGSQTKTSVAAPSKPASPGKASAADDGEPPKKSIGLIIAIAVLVLAVAGVGIVLFLK